MITIFFIGKSQSLENALVNVEGVKIHYLHIDEDKTYPENVTKFYNIVQKESNDFGFVGIGLGGFYATRLAERFCVRSVLIDTVVDAYREIEWDDNRVAESYYPALVTTVTLKPLLLQTYKNPLAERFYATEATYFDGNYQKVAKDIVNFLQNKFTFNELLGNVLAKY